MIECLYYPGCCISDRANACQVSLLSVAGALDIELRELGGWNCCGAACHVASDDIQALTLAARNLALAETSGGTDLVTPCSLCHHVLSRAKHHLDMYPDIRIRVGSALAEAGLRYRGTVRIRHLLDVLLDDVGEQRIAERVTRPLEEVVVAPYYGCQFFHRHSSASAARKPGPLERLLAATGARPGDFPSRLRCCGGVQLRRLPTAGLRGVVALLQEAGDSGAQIVVTSCPACHQNFVSHQEMAEDRCGIPPMPVLYVAQFLGLAMGLPVSQLGVTWDVESILARRAEHVA